MGLKDKHLRSLYAKQYYHTKKINGIYSLICLGCGKLFKSHIPIQTYCSRYCWDTNRPPKSNRLSPEEKSKRRKERARRYYLQKRGTIKYAVRMGVRRRRAEARKFIADFKASLSCIRCGYNEHPIALDFHHRENTGKIANISKLVLAGASLSRIKCELEKCDILCANCHRIFHDEN